MGGQLESIVQELRAAAARLQRLGNALPEPAWLHRRAPGSWSAAEAVEHLNRTSEAFLPLIHEALSRGRSMPHVPGRRFRRDPMGWLLSLVMKAPVLLTRSRTSADFDPLEALLPAPRELVARFERLQNDLIACVEAATELPLDSLWVHSPFDGRIRYNLYSCLVMLPRHQHRHLGQAERAAGAAASASPPPRAA